MIINNQKKQELIQMISRRRFEKLKNKPHIVLTGPSGSGKTTLARGIVSAQRLFYDFSVAATTRPRGENEIHSVDYFFMSEDEFLKAPMLEDNCYGGNKRLYGTLVQEVTRITLEDPKSMVLAPDIHGGKALKDLFRDDLFWIFLKTPPSTLLSRFKRRQKERGQSDAEIASRIRTAEEEYSKIGKNGFFPDLILPYDDNDRPEEVVNEILVKSSLSSLSSVLKQQ